MRAAVQMYTLRESTRTVEGLDESLRRVAAMGYGAVQLSAIGAWDAGLLEAGELRAMLDRHGLACCATHRPLARLREATDEEIAIHHTLGCRYVAVGGIWNEYGTEADAYPRFAADLAPTIARLAEAGIAFGYHNHAHEFMRAADGRGHRYDALFDAPGLMLEIDTYWVALAGLSPQALLARAAGRIPVVHLKDLEVVGWDGPTFAPVGEGNLDWDAVLAACRAGGTEWLVVEQDACRRDPFDCLASSLRFLEGRLRSTGGL